MGNACYHMITDDHQLISSITEMGDETRLHTIYSSLDLTMGVYNGIQSFHTFSEADISYREDLEIGSTCSRVGIKSSSYMKK